MKKLLFLAILAVAFVTCTQQNPTPSPNTFPSVTPTITTGCQANDQDQYVYSPDRLSVQLPCLHVVGTVDFIRNEADGDYHIGLRLDPAYQQYVNMCNSTCVGGAERGDLVVEPVCELSVTQNDAISTCAKDQDPVNVNGIKVGQHVWMEGRYVLDNDHGGWAELHPLYRWGIQ